MIYDCNVTRLPLHGFYALDDYSTYMLILGLSPAYRTNIDVYDLPDRLPLSVLPMSPSSTTPIDSVRFIIGLTCGVPDYTMYTEEELFQESLVYEVKHGWDFEFLIQVQKILKKVYLYSNSHVRSRVRKKNQQKIAHPYPYVKNSFQIKREQ